MHKKMIAAVAPFALALPLALAAPASAMPAPIHPIRPTPLTCEIKASPVKVFRGPALIKWEAVVAKKQTRDNVLIQVTDNGRFLMGDFVRGAFANRVTANLKGVTANLKGTDVLKISAYDSSTHQLCVDTAVVKEAHR